MEEGDLRGDDFVKNLVSQLPLLENDGPIGELIRGAREGLFFGVATRLPYAIVGLIRSLFFPDPVRPARSIQATLRFALPQVWDHGWILARIAVLFKISENGLSAVTALLNGVTPKWGVASQWHTFVAGMISSNLVLVWDLFGYRMVSGAASAKIGQSGGLDSLKTQMNMAIGIRCLYAIAIWCLQRFPNKMIPNTYNGRRRGEYVWFTIMWGFVMWHWKHGNGQNNPSYKSVKSQLGAMDSIYTRGDTPLLSNWTYKNYIYWLVAIVIYVKMFGTAPGSGRKLLNSHQTGGRSFEDGGLQPPSMARISSNSFITSIYPTE
jgi:hypothetical protein